MRGVASERIAAMRLVSARPLAVGIEFLVRIATFVIMVVRSLSAGLVEHVSVVVVRRERGVAVERIDATKLVSTHPHGVGIVSHVRTDISVITAMKSPERESNQLAPKDMLGAISTSHSVI